MQLELFADVLARYPGVQVELVGRHSRDVQEDLRRGRLEAAMIAVPTVTSEGMSVTPVVRQAMAGMLWTKQYYFFDLDLWLDEHKANPISGGKRRNACSSAGKASRTISRSSCRLVARSFTSQASDSTQARCRSE